MKRHHIVGSLSEEDDYSLQYASGLAFDHFGNLYVAEHFKNRVRMFPIDHSSCSLDERIRECAKCSLRRQLQARKLPV